MPDPNYLSEIEREDGTVLTMRDAEVQETINATNPLLQQILQGITDIKNDIGDVDDIIDGILDGSSAPEDYPDLTEFAAISHRGLCTPYATIPENSIEAFEKSKRAGFKWIETDIRHTSDDVPMLCHDATIRVNETSSTYTIANTTWETISNCTVSGYTNKVCSLEDALTYCRANDIYMYIEIKDGTQAQIEADYALVEAKGMKKRVVWIAFDITHLGYIKTIDPNARLQYLIDTTVTSTHISNAAALKTGTNQVGLDVKSDYCSQSLVNNAAEAGLTVSVWTVDNFTTAINFYDVGVKQVTSNTVNTEICVRTRRVVQGSEFVHGKISSDDNVKKGLKTSDTSRGSYIGTAITVRSGCTYGIRAIVSSSKTIQIGAQTLGSYWYQKILQDAVVSSNDRNDSGWKPTGSWFTVEIGRTTLTQTSRQPAIFAFTTHYTDNSEFNLSDIDYVEIVETGDSLVL